jgi:predicted deacylase
MGQHSSQQALPAFEVRLSAPDLYDWRVGNTGISGVTTRDSGKPGPHVALLAITHGNEIAGAIALDRVLRAGLMPTIGRLSFVFGNMAAHDRFDPARPTASRFVDEDMNRVWDESVLDGPRHSVELTRARELRPLIDTVDVLLDIHSMLWDADPLMLCGSASRGRALARSIGAPSLVVADVGHANGKRIIDYTRFVGAETTCAANLVEAGQHWQPGTVATALECIAGLLRGLGIVDADAPLPPLTAQPQRLAEVTQTVTAATGKFQFVQPWRGGDVVPMRNTLLALDGETEIRTPHDACLLVMPSLRPTRGHTAVRLARFVA